MKIGDVKNLKPGDRVYWNDPDDGIRSGVKEIKTIKVERDRWITIETSTGATFECIPSELSRPPAHYM